MLFFNVLGSVGIFSGYEVYRLNFDGGAVSETLALIMVYQAAAYYFFAGGYILLREPLGGQFKAGRVDVLVCVVGVVGILLISLLYYLETDVFLGKH